MARVALGDRFRDGADLSLSERVEEVGAEEPVVHLDDSIQLHRFYQTYNGLDGETAGGGESVESTGDVVGEGGADVRVVEFGVVEGGGDEVVADGEE